MKKVMLFIDNDFSKLPIGWVEFNEELVNPEKHIITFSYEKNSKKIINASLSPNIHHNPSFDDLFNGRI